MSENGNKVDDGLMPEEKVEADVETPPSPTPPTAHVDEKLDSFDPPPFDKPVRVTYADIFKQFVLLGWTAFGGPAAHIALFQKIFVERLHWMKMGIFTELLALGQCLPGPTSTQMSFAIGVTKKGIPGGLLSGILFQYPGLIMMTLFGAGAATYLDRPPAWLSALANGFGAVGVALVAGAAVGLLTKLCATKTLGVLAGISAVFAYYYPTAYMFPVLIVFGGAVSWFVRRKEPVLVDAEKEELDREVESLGLGRVGGAVLILIWICTLVGTIVARSLTSYSNHAMLPLHWFEAFFRIGSIIFGGGQVVLPMIMDEVVQCEGGTGAGVSTTCVETATSWVTSEQFLAGLGLVQAMPGPLFNLSAYLGAVMAIRAGYSFIVGTAVCWVGLFGPGLLLIYGVLPYWGKFRKLPVYRRALPGLNASAVGLVVAAVFSLFNRVLTASTMTFPNAAVCIMIIAYVVVERLNCPPPIMVLVGGGLGVFAWAVKMN